jgi:hypothetical protein
MRPWEANMTLGEVIAFLKTVDSRTEVAVGFDKAHSYRGYYHDVAFEPVQNTTVGEMLEAAKNAVGQTFQGWKGGWYTMTEEAGVYLAFEGCCGESLGPVLLGYMTGNLGDALALVERR